MKTNKIRRIYTPPTIEVLMVDCEISSMLSSGEPPGEPTGWSAPAQNQSLFPDKVDYGNRTSPYGGRTPFSK